VLFPWRYQNPGNDLLLVGKAEKDRQLEPNDRDTAERAQWTFGQLLEWHMDHGTRPGGKIDRPGPKWTSGKLQEAVGLKSDRTIRYWLKNEHVPPESETLERVLFGKDPCFDEWRLELRRAYRRSRAAMGNEVTPAPEMQLASLTDVRTAFREMLRERDSPQSTTIEVERALDSIEYSATTDLQDQKSLQNVILQFLNTVGRSRTSTYHWPAILNELAFEITEMRRHLAETQGEPAEITKNQDVANNALIEGDYATASAALETVRLLKKQVYLSQLRAFEENVAGYAKTLSQIAALSLSQGKYAEARNKYVEILGLSNLPLHYRKRYERLATLSFTALINLAPDFLTAHNTFKEMLVIKIKPDRITYNTLIKLSPDYAIARITFNEMLAAGVTPDEVTYNILVNLAEHYAAARTVFNEMLAADIKPNKVTYTTLISLAPDHAVARSVFDEMLAEQVKSDEITFGILINLAPNYDVARQIFDEMLDSEVKANEVTYNTLISKVSDYSVARKVLDEMFTAGVKPDEVTYSILIGLTRQYSVARGIFDEMLEAGVKPTEVTYSALISLAPDYKISRKLFDEMVSAQVKPDKISFNMLINSAPDYVTGRHVFDEMLAVDVKPDKVTYNTLINLAPNYAIAHCIFDEMLTTKIKPDEVTTTTMLKKADNFETGAMLIDLLEAKGVYAGLGSYCAVFSKPITHLSSEQLLKVYFARPHRFGESLQSPINQYRRIKRYYDAFCISLVAPHTSAALKLFRDEYNICLHHFLSELKKGVDDDNLHYAFGIAACLNKDWPNADIHLRVALQRSYHPKRTAHIKALLTTTPSGT
jgi:tetratricopeptide (TPR) repeat protein